MLIRGIQLKTDKRFWIGVDILVAVFLIVTSTNLLQYALGAVMAGLVARDIYELKEKQHVKRIK